MKGVKDEKTTLTCTTERRDRLKVYCINNNIKPMHDFVARIIDQAIKNKEV